MYCCMLSCKFTKFLDIIIIVFKSTVKSKYTFYMLLTNKKKKNAQYIAYFVN